MERHVEHVERGRGCARLAGLGILLAVGCRVPAEPPPEFVHDGRMTPAVDTTTEGEGETRAVDPFAAAEAEARAEERRAVEDPAACLREFSRDAGYGEPIAQLQGLAASCDRAGLGHRVCVAGSWMTRAAAECLAVTRFMDPNAELTSNLAVDTRRGKMVWTVTGVLRTQDTVKRWEVELDAQSGAFLGIRSQSATSTP